MTHMEVSELSSPVYIIHHNVIISLMRQPCWSLATHIGTCQPSDPHLSHGGRFIHTSYEVTEL